MKYHRKQIKLDNPISFLKYFENEEKFCFFNPLKKELILGAKRFKTVSSKENMMEYLYIFSTMKFFKTIKDEKWADFDDENIIFEYYLVEKDGIQNLYYLKDYIDIENIRINAYKHTFKYEMNDYSNWQELFSSAKDEILNKKLNKVVISREVKIECDTPIHVESVLNKLLSENANSFVFFYFKNERTFLGATPEILIQKEKNNILSYALAGTILRRDKEDELQKSILLNDTKNLHEHKIVVDSIARVMNIFADELTVEETKVLTLQNLYHLQTCIHGKSKNTSLFEWVKLLHPTPALGGNPVNRALEFIKKHEKHERGLYAAPIGVVDANGDGVFVAGIRSALIEKNIAYAYAGCGIVNESDCENEYIETKNKLKTIIESL